jgi:hypothetical protein
MTPAISYSPLSMTPAMYYPGVVVNGNNLSPVSLTLVIKPCSGLSSIP